MSRADIIAALTPIAETFDQLGVPYSVAGSVASSAHGIARATLDVDLVAHLRSDHIDELVAALRDHYYIDKDAALDAVARQSMFNVVHLSTMLKVDIYLLTTRPYDRESFGRRSKARLEAAVDGRQFQLDSAEDTILHKLEWYRLGDGVSERQWGDVIGVLRVQRNALDLDYMRRWAADLGVADLLERALQQAEDEEG